MPVGTVKQHEGAFALVTMERQDMCGECHACEIVGEVKKCEVKCINDCQAPIGAKVEIDLLQQHFMKATLLMYGLPLLAMMSGLLLGMLIPESVGKLVRELGMVGCAVILTGLSLWWLKSQDKKRRFNKLLPTITRIIE